MLSAMRWMLSILIIIGCAAIGDHAAGPWAVSVHTSGGISGSGVGAYSIGSDGTVEITTMNGQRCRRQASPDELAKFSRLVAAARSDRWRASYAPEERCCDRIHYTLTLETADRIRTVAWIDDPLPMPADLAALADALAGGGDSLRVRPGC